MDIESLSSFSQSSTELQVSFVLLLAFLRLCTHPSQQQVEVAGLSVEPPRNRYYLSESVNLAEMTRKNAESELNSQAVAVGQFSPLNRPRSER